MTVKRLQNTYENYSELKIVSSFKSMMQALHRTCIQQGKKNIKSLQNQTQGQIPQIQKIRIK